jgi:hypothetical protein
LVCVPVVVNAGGCVIVNVRLPVQPLASVTVTVYVPGHNPVAVAALPPEGAHEYVYGPVPPVTVALADPVHCPLQDTLVCVPPIVRPPPEVETVIATVPTLAQASVTVTVYVPAHKLVAVAAFPPEGAHEYVYGAVPPETETEALPLQLEQLAGELDGVNVNALAAGQVIHVVERQ